MKLWLDDKRNAPDGWVHVFWPNSVIAFIEKGIVSHISLDPDLGHGIVSSYDVISWLEKKLNNDPKFPLPEMSVHTMNPAGKKKMLRALSILQSKAKS